MSATSQAHCSSHEEQRHIPSPVNRMVGLERAAERLGLGGQKVIADALGISPRALRHKTSGRTSITRFDLISAAKELERVAAGLIEHARKLREEAGPISTGEKQ